MDHDDWPDWPADDAHHPDDVDTADLHDAQHGIDGGLDDLGEHDGGFDGDQHDLPAHEPHHGDLSPADLGDEHDGPDAAHDHGTGGHGAYLEDDPFSHDSHDALDPHHHDDLPGLPDPSGEHQHVAVDHLVGADPDLDPHADDAGWDDHHFPPPVDLDHVPAPVDGFPWSDPRTLGGGGVDDGAHLQAGWTGPQPADLLDYAGLETPAGGAGEGWQALLGSDDPATSSLARWWAPDD